MGMHYNKRPPLNDSFRYALNGIWHTFLSERNFKIQLVCAFGAISVSFLFNVGFLHTVMVLYAIFFVLCTELVNTAVEALTDLVCGDKPHPMAKIAKDCAAGAVLLASIQAAAVALLVGYHIFRGV
jgi:diacylglycerol kinase